MDINLFTERISTSFNDYEDREIVIPKNRDQAIVEWTIRCLANVDCEQSQEVLVAIQQRRHLQLRSESKTDLLENVRAVMRIIDATITTIQWDCYTKNDDGFYVLTAWIPRKDEQRDFLIIEMYDTDKPEEVFYHTSSAKYSKALMIALYGSDENHNSCRSIAEIVEVPFN